MHSYMPGNVYYIRIFQLEIRCETVGRVIVGEPQTQAKGQSRGCMLYTDMF